MPNYGQTILCSTFRVFCPTEEETVFRQYNHIKATQLEAILCHLRIIKILTYFSNISALCAFVTQKKKKGGGQPSL